MTRTSLAPALGHPAPHLSTLPRALKHSRRDHLIGALVSLSIILGAAGWGELVKGGHPKPRVRPSVTADQFITMPWIPPESPDAAPDEPIRASVDLRPPVLTDVPSLRPSTFLQALEPPPAGGTGAGSLLTIPVDPLHFDNTSKIFDPSQLDRQPAPLAQTHPNYPFEMRRDNISGQVVVDFVVDATGRVSRAFAASSSQREFESAAVAAVSKWRFQPGRKGGRAVATHMQVPIVFTLTPDSP